MGSDKLDKDFSNTCKATYRFGFNGQERTDEVSGVGNHNTAMYWEYDTRLGRRWNVDPIKKPWQSDYACFSNSPIWKVDPNGDDDFFNKSGKFLYSDGKKSDVIWIQNAKGTYQQLKDAQFTATNAQSLANIGNFYAQQIGLDPGTLSGKSMSVGRLGSVRNSDGDYEMGSISLYNNGVAGYSEIMSRNDENNTISIKVDGAGRVEDLLNNASNFKSTVRHEFFHKSIPGGDGFEHLEVFYKQITSPEFKATTAEFKENEYSIVQSLIGKAMNFSDDKGNYTKEQIKQIRQLGKTWDTKFKKATNNYEIKK